MSLVFPLITRLIPARAGNITQCRANLRLGPAHPRSRGEHAGSGAGNISIMTSLPGVAAAHPRSRGEHSGRVSSSTIRCGSSPLARGTCEIYRRVQVQQRLIPARAGNIPRLLPLACRRSAHPRSRGEHLVSESMTARVSGSSPLARGTFEDVEKLAELIRLIPARAGNIGINNLVIWCSPAHPRSRGEHQVMHADKIIGFGSSPLARGT